MSNLPSYIRPQAEDILQRLMEPRGFIQVLSGARQVGKTTLARQVADQSGLPMHYASADQPALRDISWIGQQWEAARLLADEADQSGALLILDEVQKVTGWSEAVKAYWDIDTHVGRPLKIVLLGSAPLLVQRGLGESLAGRFEVSFLPHWSFAEMREAFGWSLEQYIFYGAYPGAARLIRQPTRWARYIRDSLIEPTISRDVLLLSRVHKPALLRRMLELSCAYSGQILSYNKMLGQLQDAGNTTTLAYYLDLLAGVGLVTGLAKFSKAKVRQRASSPKLQVFNTALITAQKNIALSEARKDSDYGGHLVESAVGAHLVNSTLSGDCAVHYWREQGREVDFIVQSDDHVVAIEVKSGRPSGARAGMTAFSKLFRPTRKLLVGEGGIDLETFLLRPVTDWLRP